MARWVTEQRGGVVHVAPVDDDVAHELVGLAACVCGPRAEAMIGWAITDAGTSRPFHLGWLVTHHSLDGREFSERCL